LKEILTKILAGFSPISLKDMDDVSLLNRIDSKFLVDKPLLFSIMYEAFNDYDVLEIEGQRYTTYDTLYFDDADAKLYLMHHNGNGSRYKVRHRTYLESGLGFLEVKFKTSTGRTIKKRIKGAKDSTLTSEVQANFLKNNLGDRLLKFEPKIHVQYKRITLVNKNKAERVTIDLDLGFHRNDTPIEFNNLAIIEVKQGSKARSVFFDNIKSRYIREHSMSKYCIGMALKYPELKRNNFKYIINRITQLNKTSYI
jgi:VTC domain